MKAYLETDGVFSYAAARSFRFKKNRVFAKAHFRKKHILLELRVGQNNIADPDFKYWRQGASDWGWTHIYPSTGVPEKVINWIDLARGFSDEREFEEDDDTEG